MFTIGCKDLLWCCGIIFDKGLVLFNPCFLSFINERRVTPVAMETTKEWPCANLITGVCLVTPLPASITRALKASMLRGGGTPLVKEGHVQSQSRGTLSRRSFGVLSCSHPIHYKALDVSSSVWIIILGGWGSGRSTYATTPLSCSYVIHNATLI